MFSSIYNNVII